MKTKLIGKSIILLAVLFVASTIFIGCQSMDDAKHNDEDGRDGVSGYALTMRINPSRAPANNNATMQASIRFVKLKDMSPVPNARIRLKINGFAEYLDPDIVHFGERTLLTDVVTNASGEATVTMYVGGVGRAIPELVYTLDAQSTIEYDNWNTLIYYAEEAFYIYNPYWDGTTPPDTTPPTAVMSFFPSTGITTTTTVTFMGGNSYDGGNSADPWGAEKEYGQIRTYNWNMGDNKFKSGKTVTHVYTKTGSYSVELLVIDDEGMTGQTSGSLTVDADED